MTKFPQDIQESVAKVVYESRDNTRITVVIALNYGGRDEIISAVNRVVIEKNENEDFGGVTAEEFEEGLYTSGMPDPEIIVRTGGEMRLSGFMPWQSVYSELFFVDTLWPDFMPDQFAKILEEFSVRERRFGK